VQCAESLRLQAAFDGELDPLSAAAIERHAALCPECRALREHLERTRTALRALDHGRAPPGLRARIAGMLDEESRPGLESRWRRPFWLGAASGAAGAALAAALAFLALAPLTPAGLPEELTEAHVRSLDAGRLTEVVSTDRHTVKPWFAGRADVSPVVADFAPQGFTLLGGRTARVEKQRAAVLVYRHGAHVIDVFAFAAPRERLPAATSRRGYHIACWKSADLGYCMVSDAGWEEMQALTRLLQELAARDARE
jgi:anti-sigma factor RsiW